MANAQNIGAVEFHRKTPEGRPGARIARDQMHRITLLMMLRYALLPADILAWHGHEAADPARIDWAALDWHMREELSGGQAIATPIAAQARRPHGHTNVNEALPYRLWAECRLDDGTTRFICYAAYRHLADAHLAAQRDARAGSFVFLQSPDRDEPREYNPFTQAGAGA